MLSMGGERKETCAEVAAAVVEDRGNCKSVNSLRFGNKGKKGNAAKLSLLKQQQLAAQKYSFLYSTQSVSRQTVN